MQSKSTVALAAIVALAATANAGNVNTGVSVKTVGNVVPNVSAVKLPQLSTIPQLPSVNLQAPVISQQTIMGSMQADQRVQIITAQDQGSQAQKPAASQAFFDNGSMKQGSEISPAVAGVNGTGLAPLSANTGAVTRTQASVGLSRIAYGSYNLANGGMVWDAIKRIGRAIGSIFSIFSKKVNTPELSAEAYLSDLKTRGEKMQQLVAGAAKTVSLLRIQVKDEAGKIATLSSKRDAALKAGKDDIAMSYDGQLTPLEATHASNKEQLAAAEQNLENAKRTLAEFVQKRQSEFARVQAKLGEVKAKEAQAELSKLKNSMNMGSIESKDEFDRAVNDKIAGAEGEIEAGKATGQDETEEFERQMERDAAKERLEQRKKELGLGGSTDEKKS